jgi:hypothetical protein
VCILGRMPGLDWSPDAECQRRALLPLCSRLVQKEHGKESCQIFFKMKKKEFSPTYYSAGAHL